MVITIKELNSGGATIFSSGTIQIGGVAPAIFFTKKSFQTNSQPVWSVNQAINREGNYTHYNGSDDDTITAEIYLYGTDRFTNLATVKTIFKQIFYLDATDVDSNVNGQYTIDGRPKISYDMGKSLIIVDMIWKAYNN